MNSILIALAVVAFTGLVHLAVLVVGSRLVRRSENNSDAPNSSNVDPRFVRAKWELKRLKNRLERAHIKPPEEIPSDVVTMNSRAELLDVESGEHMEFTPVWPIDADIHDGKVSVSTPLGARMLGKRVGTTFEWPVPYGIRRLKVEKVHLQSGANLQQAA